MATRTKNAAKPVTATVAPAMDMAQMMAMMQAMQAQLAAATAKPTKQAKAEPAKVEPQWLDLEPGQVVAGTLTDGRKVWMRRGRSGTVVTLNDPALWIKAGK